MSQKAIEGLVGPVWVLCGLVMATSPPLDHSAASFRGSFGQHSQLFGVLIAAAGAWMAINGLRDGGRSRDGLTAKRARPAWTPRQRVIVGGVLLVGAILAAGAFWAALLTRNPAMWSLVILVLSVCVILAPRAVDGLRGRNGVDDA